MSGVDRIPHDAAAPRALVVDDDALVLHALEQSLSFLGFVVIATTSPVEAMHFAVGGANFDVLVTDLEMPVLSGLDLIAQLERADIKIPSLVVSAGGRLAARIQPPQRWLAKPVGLAELARMLAALGVPAPRAD